MRIGVGHGFPCFKQGMPARPVLTPARAGVLAGIVISLAAGVVMVDISHRLANREAAGDLAAIAQRVLARSESVATEALGALGRLRDLPASGPCSAQAMERYSVVLSGSRHLRAIGGRETDGSGCFNLGGRKISVSLPAPAWTDQKYAVWLGAGGPLGLPSETMMLSFGQVFAAMDPIWLVDVTTPGDVHVALLEPVSGAPIAATAGANVSAMAAARSSTDLVEANEDLYLAKRHASAPVVAVVAQRKLSHLQHWRGEGWIWFAVALIFGVLGGLAAGAAMRRRLSPQAQLKRALDKREFVVHYQPIVCLQSGDLVGAEALVRWRLPDGTMMRPDLFIPLAEQTGLVLPLTDQVLESVVTDLAGPLRALPIYVSVNLSARDVGATRVLDLTERLLRYMDIPQGRIAFEATERGFVDAENARESLRRYRRAGHQIFIDDFGTGYSSLSQLQSLEVDAIKIDKSFVDAVGTGAATHSVVPHIIAMAKALGLKLVAEGVETEVQMQYLREQGVEYGQGWLFGKPMPARQLLDYRSSKLQPALSFA